MNDTPTPSKDASEAARRLFKILIENRFNLGVTEIARIIDQHFRQSSTQVGEAEAEEAVSDEI